MQGFRVNYDIRDNFSILTLIFKRNFKSMKNGQCPKCGAQEVHLMNGPFADTVSVPLGSWSSASADYYVCVKCGYLEFYVRNPDDLPKIAEKWPRIKVS